MFSFAFFSLYSAYFSVLSNFLLRFPRLALHLLLVALPLSFQPIFTQNPLSTNLNDVNFLRLKSFSFAGIVALRVDKKLQNTKNYRSTTTSTVWFPAQTRVANYLLTRFHIYQPTWNPRVIPNRVHAVRSTKGRHSTMRASLSSAGVSWRTLMGYPSYARNCACALPSPSPYHYVMAKIVLRENLLTFPCVVIRNIFIR